MTGRVWIAEDEDGDVDGWYLLGTFSGYHDSGEGRPLAEFSGLSAEEAIRWGRERSDVVLIRLGRSDYFTAGDRNVEPGYPSWPPPALPELRRRRPPEEAWKDRGTDDPPIEWRVIVALSPPGFGLGEPFSLDVDPSRADWEAKVREVADHSGAQSWDDEELNGFVGDIRSHEQAAGGGDYGWTTSHSAAYRLHFLCEASTAAEAENDVRGRVGDVPGWGIEITTEPAKELPRGFRIA